MAAPPEANPPQSRAVAVVRDIGAVAAEAARRAGAGGVALLGWATGGMWASFFASLYPERVTHVVALNALYGGSDRHAMLERSADPAHPERLAPTIGAYGLNAAAALLPGWDGSIPLADKALWRDPAIAEAYVAAAFTKRAAAACSTRARSPLPCSWRAPSAISGAGPKTSQHSRATPCMRAAWRRSPCPTRRILCISIAPSAAARR
jgi:pimeloyl-ACP methyl ester carboxylesterase